MDNRQGLVVQACVTPATGTAEWEAALAMVARVPAGATLGADRGYDTRAFVAQVRARGLRVGRVLFEAGADRASRDVGQPPH
jgi:IS5 family transposase